MCPFKNIEAVFCCAELNQSSGNQVHVNYRTFKRRQKICEGRIELTNTKRVGMAAVVSESSNLVRRVFNIKMQPGSNFPCNIPTAKCHCNAGGEEGVISDPGFKMLLWNASRSSLATRQPPTHQAHWGPLQRLFPHG